MVDSDLSEKDFVDVSKKALGRDVKGTAEALATTLAGSGTGHPLAGAIAGKVVGAIAEILTDTNTPKFLDGLGLHYRSAEGDGQDRHL